MTAICHRLVKDSIPYGFIALTGDASLPAIGGVRILEREFDETGVHLAYELAETMRLKAQYAQLPLQGGKAVLYLPSCQSRSFWLKAFAEAINELRGQYITAVDIGSDQSDMDVLSEHTSYLTCCTALGGDPSGYTAQTVILGIEAWSERKTYESKLAIASVCIQGLGKVGRALVEQLNVKYPSMQLIGADPVIPEPEWLNAVNIELVLPEMVDSMPCDIFIAAADSGLIGDKVAKGLSAEVLVCAANNPFSGAAVAGELLERGVDVLPDYVVNSGGLIYCAYQRAMIDNLSSVIGAVKPTTQNYLLGHAYAEVS